MALLKPSPSLLKYAPFLILISILIGNIYLFAFHPDPYTQLRQSLFSPSVGSRYYARLRLWYFLAQKGFWDQASKIESSLDSVDIQNYKATYHPDAIFSKISILSQKPPQTAEDWLYLAQLQLQGNYPADALKSLKQAQILDPIRDDISHFIYQIENQLGN